MTIKPADGKVPFDVVKDLNKPYRLWCKAMTGGNPIIILVHGAVAPLLDKLHRIDCPNNDKYCFYQLDSFLYDDYRYNVFSFEYANIRVTNLSGTIEFGYVNYGSLEDYGKMLIEAIGVARKCIERLGGTVGSVNVIAHSMGGLIARYAVQNIQDVKVSKIITLDTGHRGFRLAQIADDLVVHPLQGLIKLPTLCSQDAEPNSKFVTALTDGFPACPPLVSLAATQPIQPSELGPLLPPVQITVVGLESSNMGQVYCLPCDHMSIAQITNRSHLAYQRIRNPPLRFFR